MKMLFGLRISTDRAISARISAMQIDSTILRSENPMHSCPFGSGDQLHPLLESLVAYHTDGHMGDNVAIQRESITILD